MTLNEHTAIGEAWAPRHHEAGTVAAWWIGAFMAAVALIAFAAAISREPARELPRPTALVPVAVTVARSAPPPAPAKPARVKETENGMREASNKAAETFNSIVLPPPAVPPGPPQPLRPL